MGWGKFKNVFCYANVVGGSSRAFGGESMELEIWVGSGMKNKQILTTIDVSVDFERGKAILKIDGKEVKQVYI